MMKTLKKLTALFLALILALVIGAAGPAGAEAAGEQINRFNVVLVIDKSGSLRDLEGHGTDPDGLRFDAMRLFLGLLTEQGNNVGAVVFDEQIRYDSGLKAVSSMADKKKLVEKVESFGTSYDTDIGSAVLRATEILTGMQAENGLPCMILLLTDGKSDFSSTVGDYQWSRLRASYMAADKALKAARSAGIVINGILLNVNGVADGGEVELQLYTDGTGGAFEQVTRPEDLSAAFRRFYSIINNTEYTGSDAVAFSADGEASTSFVVPPFGVEEVNVVVEHNALSDIWDSEEEEADEVRTFSAGDITVMCPDGSVFDTAGHDLFSSRYSLVKIPYPAMGVWNVSLKGAPGDTVDITMVYNASMSAVLRGSSNDGKYSANKPCTFFVSIADSSVPEITEEDLSSLHAVLEIADADTGGVIKKIPMDVTLGGYVCEMSFEREGNYRVSALVGAEGFEVRSNSVDAAVTFPPMTVKISRVSDIFSCGTFRDDCWELDLSELVEDTGGGVLSYTLSDNFNGALTVNDGVLTMRAPGVEHVAFVLTATDLLGRSAQIPFDFTIPAVTNRVSGIGGLDECGTLGDNGWEVDLSTIFNDSTKLGLRYTVSDDYDGAVSVEGDTLRVYDIGRDQASFSVTATNIMGLRASVPFDLTIPAVEADISDVTEMDLYGSFHDDVWDMELDSLFYDEKNAALRYSVSDDYNGAVSVENGLLTVRAPGTDTLSFTLTATDVMGLSAEVPFELSIPKVKANFDEITNMLRYGRFHDRLWDADLSLLFTDPKESLLQYSLSDDFDGALTVVDGNVLRMDVDRLRGADFTVTATDVFGLKAELPFRLQLPGPGVSGGISETVRTGLFQKGTWSLNIGSYFSEPKGTALSYVLSDGHGGAVTLDGTTLSADCKGLGSASFSVTATDGYGLSASLPVTLTEKNMTPTYLLYGLLGLVALAIPTWLIIYIFRRRY